MQRPEQSSAAQPREAFIHTVQEAREDAAAVRAKSRQVREHAAALRAESRQARRHAAEIHAESNAILDTVALMMTNVLRHRGYGLRAPVAAKFRTAECGSTGFEIAVRLDDPSRAGAARAALVERFPDPLSDVIVS